MEHMVIAWDNEEHTAISIVLYPGWTWKDFYDCVPEVSAMMKTTEQPVYIVCDQTLAAATPIGVFMHARNFLAALPANFELIIIVTPSLVVQRLVIVFQATYKGYLGTKIKSARSVEDAHRLLETMTVKSG